jgi:hypothetical protein
MSFNRLKYDNNEYYENTNYNNNICEYRIFGNYAENKNQCYSANILGSVPNVSSVRKYDDLTFTNLANNESMLSNRIKLDKNIQKYDKKDCNEALNGQVSRFSDPTDKFREIGYDKLLFAPFLFFNPNKKISNINFKSGLGTRNYMRDNFKQKQVDMIEKGEALPPFI